MKCLRLVPFILWALASAAQSGRVAAVTAQEFPAVLAETVEAGKTPVGTAVSAHLAMGTLAGGVVIPEGAVLSGVVEQSFVKTGTLSTRLKIHMTQATWKDHTLAVNLYLTDQYYPKVADQDADRSQYDASNSSRSDVKLRSRNLLTTDGYQTRTSIETTDPASSLKSADQIGKGPGHSGAMSGFAGRLRMKGTATVLDGGGIAVISEAKKLKLDRTTCYSFEGVTSAPESGLHASN